MLPPIAVRALCSLLVLFGAAAVRAQGAPPASGAEALAAAEAAYETFDYAEAEALTRATLAAYETLSPDALVRTHVLLALTLYARNEPREARGHLATALALDPALTLDPVRVSPKIIEDFAALREQRGRNGAAADEAPVRYVLVRDPRPGAALRSMALPGWGQVQRGDRLKGAVLGALWVGTAGGSVVAHLRRASAEEAYLAAPDPDQASARYEDFRAWHRARNGLLWAAAGVWSAALVDALWYGRPTGPATLALRPSLGPDAWAVSVGVRW